MTIAVRDYTDASQMLADYAARRARMYGVKPSLVEREVKREPSAFKSEFEAAVRACSRSEWDEEEDAEIKRCAALGYSASEIGQRVTRTPQAIVARAKRLNIKIRHVKPPKVVKPKEQELQDAIKLYRLVLDTSVSHVGRARQIMKAAAEEAGFTVADMLSERKPVAMANARMKAMWLIARETTMSYPAIGRMFGGRDHTTVLNAVRRLNERTGENVRNAGLPR